MNHLSSKICLALDGLSFEKALRLTNQIGHLCHAVKIHDLYDDRGPRIIRDLKEAGAKRVWVDHKVKDTPDTAALRVSALVRNGAKIITVHASGGVAMMKAAVNATMSECEDELAEIWAITVLTSLDEKEIARIHGDDRTPQEIVHEFALMAKEAGVRTVVCSAKEVGMLRQSPDLSGMGFTVPGTRSTGVKIGNSQKRSGTPAQAIADGATFLVAGSQVTRADDSVAAFAAMAEEIGMDLNN